MRFCFGSCVLDGETRELHRGDREAHLSRKAFDLLEHLLERRPSAVTKEQLHQRLWKGTSVTDASLANLVSEVRRAIGDHAVQPQLLRTVHGFGYAFCGEATASPSDRSTSDLAGSCRLIFLGNELPLIEGENLLGRGTGVVAAIRDVSVSRHHARIRIVPEGAVLEDLKSKNGTLLNGERVTTAVRLKDMDEIRLGDVPLVFRHLATEISTASRRPRKERGDD